MNTDLVPASTSTLAVQGNEIAVSAATPSEFSQSQDALILWCRNKIAQCDHEADELRQAHDEAVKRKWKSSVLNRHAVKATRRTEFFKKILAALEAGYIIVPNFPVQLFAIRTDAKNPRKYLTLDRYVTHEQKAEGLPAKEGKYQNPFPEIWERDISSSLSKVQRDAGKTTLIQFSAEQWMEIDFPISMARPHIMEATTRAMALKIFDEFGILPAQHKNVDPLICARILDPRSTTYDRKTVSFIVAWRLDTSAL